MERINAFLSLGLPEIAALFAPFETSLTVLGVNLLGDWLRDYLDPKLDV